MINFRFVKSQYKRIMIPLIILAVLTLIMLIPSFTQQYMGDYTAYVKIGNGKMGTTHYGAMKFMEYIYFGIPGMLLMFIFSIIFNHMLISKEIKEGYMASWLTSSMSRKTIINSKLFVLLTGMLTILFFSMILQIIIFPITLKFFPGEAFGKLILDNLDFMLLVSLFVAINWVITNSFNKSSYSLAVISGVLAFFAIMSVTSLLYEIAPTAFDYLRVTKYFTITSLFNSSFKFLPADEGGDSNIIIDEYAHLIKGVKALDFAWQMPLMSILSPTLFVLGGELLIKKDLHL